MSIATDPRGRSTKVRIAYESTYGTAETTGFFELNTYAHDFKRNRPLVADDVLGAGYHNGVDARPAAPNVEDGSWSIEVPFDLTQIGYWLKAGLGDVTGSGTPKVHSFTSGVAALPSMTMERELASGQFEEAIGAVITKMTFSFGAGPGFHSVKIEGICKQVTEPYASTLAGTPTVVTLAARIAKSLGVVKVATTQIGAIISGEVVLTNEVVADRFVGDTAFISQVNLVNQDCEWNLDARYKTDVLRAYANLSSGLPAAQRLDVEYITSSSLKAVLTSLAVRAEPVGAPVTNGGLVTISIKGRAEVGAAAAMFTLTLTNAVTDY